MQRELLRRHVQDVVYSKIKELNKAVQVQLLLGEVINELGAPIADSEEIADALYDIEESSQGKLKLLTPIPAETETNFSKESREVLGLRGDLYFLIQYDPKAQKFSQSSDISKFILSPDGLVRYLLDGTPQKYRVRQESARYKILNALESDFRLSGDLIRDVYGSDTNRNRKRFYGQISGIREQIEDRFPGTKGTNLIEGDQGRGYRYGKAFKVEKEEN